MPGSSGGSVPSGTGTLPGDRERGREPGVLCNGGPIRGSGATDLLPPTEPVGPLGGAGYAWTSGRQKGACPEGKGGLLPLLRRPRAHCGPASVRDGSV